MPGTIEELDIRRAVAKSVDAVKCTRYLLYFLGLSIVMTVLPAVITQDFSILPTELLVLQLFPFGPLYLFFGIRLYLIRRNPEAYRICRGRLDQGRTKYGGRGYRSVRLTATFTSPSGREITKNTRWLWTESSRSDKNNYEKYLGTEVLLAYDEEKDRMLVLGTARELLYESKEGD